MLLKETFLFRAGQEYNKKVQHPGRKNQKRTQQYNIGNSAMARLGGFSSTTKLQPGNSKRKNEGCSKTG